MLADVNVVEALDSNPGYSFTKIFNADSSVASSSDGYTSEEMAALLAHAKKMAAELADRIRSGEITPSPAVIRDWNACQWCDCAGVCKLDTSIPGHEKRELPPLKKQDLLTLMANDTDAMRRTRHRKGGEFFSRIQRNFIRGIASGRKMVYNRDTKLSLTRRRLPMIQIIAGKKGSGKTKRLIDMTNNAVKTSSGNVVFLDKNDSYMYEVDRAVRFVNVEEYSVSSAEMFLGFLGGMLASNYDVKTVFIDAFLKLIKIDIADAKWFFDSLEKYAQKHDVTFVLSVSADPEALPDFCKGYII